MIGLRSGLLVLFVSQVMSTWGQDAPPRFVEVDSLVSQSRNLVEQRKYPEALSKVEEAIAMLHAAESMDSVRLARCWFNYGRALDRSGKAGEAETWYLEALRFQEGDPQGNALDLANTLNNLALLATGSGRFAEAEPLHLRALALREQNLGTADPDYLWSLNNLGVHFRQCGRYTLSAQYHLRAMEGRRLHLGVTHPDYFWSVNNLSLVNRLLGKYREAESLGEEAVTLSASIWGAGHIYHAVAINNLANLHFKLGELSGDSLHYRRSLEGYSQALAIFRQRLRAGHDYIATALNNLGKASRALGRFDDAGAFYGEARDVLDQSVGAGHPKFAQVLDNFGDLALARGQADEALRLFREARDIRRQALGPDHPHYANSMNSLGLLWWQTGVPDSAATALLEAHRVKRDQVGYASLYLSEEEQASYLEDYLLVRDQCYAFAQKFGAFVPAWAGHALEFSLHYKGLVLNNTAQVRQMAAQNPEWSTKMVRLGELRQRLLQEYLKPVAEQQGVEDLENRAEELERELIRGAAKFGHLHRDISWQALRDRLKESELIVEFVDYQWCDPSPSGQRRYAALVLGAGDAWPRFIPLFEEDELLPLLSDHRERKADYVNELYAWTDRGMVKLGSAKKSLYDLIWAKIEESGLEGITTVYYSPSGVLHRLNLGAIALDEETILSDKYHLVALNSTRQLVIPSTVTTTANDALLVGGVNFEMDSVQTFQQEQPLLASRAASEAWTESGSRGGTWSYLKWTEKEVERIATSLTTGGFAAAQLSSSEATEEAIKAIGKDGYSPRVLHLATHGFFFPDPEIAPSSRRGLGEVEPVFKSSDNPMIRSGLILAGGNYAWQHGRSVSPDREDGILTAYEISQMNLSNTELVVLSACETGLGDIRGNEGVYGLQRAFKIAGAKYLIMSLWQVPDRETMEFMTAFYRNWLEEKLPIPEAFRKTQREMRDRFYNPYSWAAFVLVE